MQTINDKCILIPTYNRADALQFYLDRKLDRFKVEGFDIVIYDSSTDKKTQEIVDTYQENGYENVIYCRYVDPEGDIYGCKKVREALVECGKSYDYVWLCGDTTMLKIEDYSDSIRSLMDEKYDVIHIYNNNIGEESRRDIDYREFFVNFFWSMTHWCSSILSSKLIKEMEPWLDFYSRQEFLSTIVYAIYAALVNKDYKIAYVNKECYTYVPYRNGSVSHRKKDLLRGHGEVHCRGIDALPSEYDEYKAIAKMSLNKNIGLFSKQNSIDLRADGNITFLKLLKYGRYVKQMTDVPIGWFYLLSIIPKSIVGKFSSSYSSDKKLNSMNQKENRIVIYGMGQHGRAIYEKVKYIYKNIHIDSVSDKNIDGKQMEKCEVVRINELDKRDFDYIVVGIVNRNVYKEVRKTLIELGIPKKKIIHL